VHAHVLPGHAACHYCRDHPLIVTPLMQHPLVPQAVIHGVAENWNSFTDDTLVQKAVRTKVLTS